MKCPYCNAEPNNATSNKNLKVCCCYRLHSVKDEFIIHPPDGEKEHIRKEDANVKTYTENT